MLKIAKAESELRKGVRLGPRGGSMFNDYKGIKYMPEFLRMFATQRFEGVSAMVQHLSRPKSKSLLIINQSTLTIQTGGIIKSCGRRKYNYDEVYRCQ